MNTAKTFLIINVPAGFNFGSGEVYLFVYADKKCTELESGMLRELQEDSFMDGFRYDTTNYDQVWLRVNEATEIILQRATEVAEKTGIVFEGEAGQFKLIKKHCRQNFQGEIKKIIGDADFKIYSDKYQIMKQEVVSQ